MQLDPTGWAHERWYDWTARMEADSDLALLVRVARGDQEAFAKLYDRHAGVLLALAQRILSERSAAEAVVHDLFIELWRTARELDPQRGTVRAWLAMRTRSIWAMRQAIICWNTPWVAT